MGTGTQALGSSAAAFPGALAVIWIRLEVVPKWYVSVTSSGLTLCVTMAGPILTFYKISEEHVVGNTKNKKSV